MRLRLYSLLFIIISIVPSAHARRRDDPLPVNLVRTGQVISEIGQGAGVFYAGVGITTAVKCLSTHDPLYCREYIYSFKDQSNYEGLAIFIAGSSVLQSFAQKAPIGGSPVFKALASEYIGMAGGSFLNTAFNDIYHLPESKQLIDSFKSGEKSDWAKREKLISSIMSQTFSNGEWWKNQGPELTSLAGAALASQASSMALNSAVERWYLHQDSKMIGCAQATVLRKIITGEGLSGGAKLTRNVALELSKFISFIAWQKAAVEPLVNRTWNRFVDQPKLQEERNRITHMRVSDVPVQGVDLKTALNQNDRVWTNYRKQQLRPVDELMSVHLNDLNEFDKSVNKTHSYYSWLKNGAKEDASWASLRDEYYTPKTKPSDLTHETHQYLQAFFNGPAPDQAFHDRLDLHGLPVPGLMKESVLPYRAAGGVDPALKMAPDSQLIKEMGSSKYEFANERALSALLDSTKIARKKRIDFYESQVETKLLDLFQKPGSKGILNSMQLQVDDLEKLKSNVKSTSDLDLIDLKISEIRSQMTAVQAIIDYYKKPRGQRASPDESMQMSDEDWALAIRYYQSYILK